ncbi:ABC transporter ATP-binding protein [Reyranella sp.]|uniref:ABC transporter ATP-binding protein n=1 Tax=Reyranella sp. TaxID=1929291 RepID=UPI003BACA047
MSEPLLKVSNLAVSIRGDEGTARILDRVDLEIPRGRIVGVVGESGCGKSTLIRAILGVLPPRSTLEAGEIVFEGRDLARLPAPVLAREVRGSAIGFIPQDPLQSLNPVFKVGAQMLETMRWHAPPEWKGRHRERLVDLLRAVQVPDPERALERYPHEFSGGQRQRLLIAASLSCQPRLLIADEPTTALDVTTQQQVLKLLRDLVAELGLSMLFVTHDFGVVAQLCDEVSVIYAGQTVEAAPTRRLIDEAAHPYARLLLGCHPDRATDLGGIPGSVPSPFTPPAGCRFHPRCPLAVDDCVRTRPVFAETSPRHAVACPRTGLPLPEGAA